MSVKKYSSSQERSKAAYAKRDKEAARKAAAEWRKNNPEKAKEHSRRTRLKNRDKVLERQRAWAAENKERRSVKSKEYYQANKDGFRDYNLRRNFGISLDEYNSILVQQSGACALCGEGPGAEGKIFAVDHDHETGHVRGLLCRGCNVGIGNLRDDPDLLDKAAEYLRHHRQAKAANGVPRFPVAVRFYTNL